MMSRLFTLMAGSLIRLTLTAPLAMAEENVVIGHFGNPTPMQVAAARDEFAEATGWTIEWREFASGAEVITAMSTTDIDIAELGSAPFVMAANQGLDLEIFMIAQIISDAESLIVRDGIGIDTIAALRHRRIAVPFGSTAHYSLIGALHKAGMTGQDVVLVDMSPDQIAAAWRQGVIDAAFVWQPVQAGLLDTGRLLVSADSTAAWGYQTFDGWVVNRTFAADHADQLSAFAKVMDDANTAYLNDPHAWISNAVTIETIVERTGAAAEQVPDILQGYTFLPIAEQIEATWFDGSLNKMLTYTAGFLTAAGEIDGVRDDYSEFINIEIMQAAAK